MIGPNVPAGTVAGFAMLNSAKRASHIDPPVSSYATAERTPELENSLDPKPPCCIMATSVAIMHIVKGAGGGVAPFLYARPSANNAEANTSAIGCRSRLG